MITARMKHRAVKVEAVRAVPLAHEARVDRIGLIQLAFLMQPDGFVELWVDVHPVGHSHSVCQDARKKGF